MLHYILLKLHIHNSIYFSRYATSNWLLQTFNVTLPVAIVVWFLYSLLLNYCLTFLLRYQAWVFENPKKPSLKTKIWYGNLKSNIIWYMFVKLVISWLICKYILLYSSGNFDDLQFECLKYGYFVYSGIVSLQGCMYKDLMWILDGTSVFLPKSSPETTSTESHQYHNQILGFCKAITF